MPNSNQPILRKPWWRSSDTNSEKFLPNSTDLGRILVQNRGTSQTMKLLLLLFVHEMIASNEWSLTFSYSSMKNEYDPVADLWAILNPNGNQKIERESLFIAEGDFRSLFSDAPGTFEKLWLLPSLKYNLFSIFFKYKNVLNTSITLTKSDNYIIQPPKPDPPKHIRV